MRELVLDLSERLHSTRHQELIKATTPIYCQSKRKGAGSGVLFRDAMVEHGIRNPQDKDLEVVPRRSAV